MADANRLLVPFSRHAFDRGFETRVLRAVEVNVLRTKPQATRGKECDVQPTAIGQRKSRIRDTRIE